MRVRASILAVVVAVGLGASLAACGGDDGDGKKPSAVNTRLGTPSADLTETAIDCAKYADTAQKITEAQQELYAGSGGSTEALDTLKSRMDALKDGAPADVEAAIEELSEAFVKAKEVLATPSAQAQQELAQLGPKLAADGQKVTAYILSRCKG